MIRGLLILSGAVAVLGAVGACAHHATFVKTTDAALGRVVVYRNGVAFYERRAHVVGGRLALRVPSDKVDDFLKSLTVADAKTGAALPVSFPTRAMLAGREVEMTIQLPDNAPRDVVLTYITESPAWKPSYRAVVGRGGKVSLQGWAIVDNTSGEDWRTVRVGVGSSSALSFRFDLHSVRLVHRETLRTNEAFAIAPPTGGTTFRDKEKETLVAALDDKEIPREQGHPDAVSADGARPAITVSNARVQQLAASLKGRRGRVVVEGYAASGEANATAKALDRANLVRNQLILQGVPPAQIEVAARGVASGVGPGVRVVEQKGGEDGAATRGAEDANGQPIGESHYESKGAMTVLRGTSALVSVLTDSTPGEIVYLYDADGQRGNGRYAFKSLRFRNPTESTLEAGPMTVFGEGRFVGEGLTDPVPPGAIAVVPFALDRQIVVERDGADSDRIARLTTLQRGVLTAEVRHTRVTRFKVTNRLHVASTVLLRHNVRRGWDITKCPEAWERFGDARLFAVVLKPGETRTVAVEEATPLQRTIDIRSPIGLDLVKVYLETPNVDRRLGEQIRKLVALHTEMENHRIAIESLRQREAEYRVRLDELHAQIASLKLLRTGGTLMAHLTEKMKEISERVQEATIQVVDHQEKLMLAKVAFNDAVSELTIAKPAAPVVPTA